jgi:hypothetical protein
MTPAEPKGLVEGPEPSDIGAELRPSSRRRRRRRRERIDASAVDTPPVRTIDTNERAQRTGRRLTWTSVPLGSRSRRKGIGHGIEISMGRHDEYCWRK